MAISGHLAACLSTLCFQPGLGFLKSRKGGGPTVVNCVLWKRNLCLWQLAVSSVNSTKSTRAFFMPQKVVTLGQLTVACLRSVPVLYFF